MNYLQEDVCPSCHRTHPGTDVGNTSLCRTCLDEVMLAQEKFLMERKMKMNNAAMDMLTSALPGGESK